MLRAEAHVADWGRHTQGDETAWPQYSRRLFDHPFGRPKNNGAVVAEDDVERLTRERKPFRIALHKRDAYTLSLREGARGAKLLPGQIDADPSRAPLAQRAA